MTKQERLLQRFLSRPKDFTWAELKTLLEGMGYEMSVSRGSLRKFVKRENGGIIVIHEPHPAKVLKAYQIRHVIRELKRTGEVN